MLKLFKYPLIIFLSGSLITIFGSWAKIMHISFADFLLTAGMMLQAVAVVFTIYVLLKQK